MTPLLGANGQLFDGPPQLWQALDQFGILAGNLMLLAALAGALWGWLKRDRIRLWLRGNRFPHIGGEADETQQWQALLFTVSRPKLPLELIRARRPQALPWWPASTPGKLPRPSPPKRTAATPSTWPAVSIPLSSGPIPPPPTCAASPGAPMKPTTQVCLVSTQPVPNFTPVLDPQLHPRHLYGQIILARMQRHLAALGVDARNEQFAPGPPDLGRDLSRLAAFQAEATRLHWLQRRHARYRRRGRIPPPLERKSLVASIESRAPTLERIERDLTNRLHRWLIETA